MIAWARPETWDLETNHGNIHEVINPRQQQLVQFLFTAHWKKGTDYAAPDALLPVPVDQPSAFDKLAAEDCVDAVKVCAHPSPSHPLHILPYPEPTGICALTSWNFSCAHHPLQRKAHTHTHSGGFSQHLLQNWWVYSLGTPRGQRHLFPWS